MRVRFTTVRGMFVVDDRTSDAVAIISDVLINPDDGAILGFFVISLGLIPGDNLFLCTQDITSWGTKVHVREMGVIGPFTELVRFTHFLEEKRTILGQRIETLEQRTYLGRCMDIGFETKDFHLTMLYPKKFFRLQAPIPASKIQEVTEEAIIVLDPELREKLPVKPVVNIPELA